MERSGRSKAALRSMSVNCENLGKLGSGRPSLAAVTWESEALDGLRLEVRIYLVQAHDVPAGGVSLMCKRRLNYFEARPPQIDPHDHVRRQSALPRL